MESSKEQHKTLDQRRHIWMRYIRKLLNTRDELVIRVQIIGIVLVVLFLLLIVLRSRTNVYQDVLLHAGAVFLAIGFVLWCWPAIKTMWRHPLGKLLFIVPNVLILWLATVFARNIVTSALGLPSNDFDMSVSVVALLLYVPACALVISVVSGAVSVCLHVWAFISNLLHKSQTGGFSLAAHSIGAFVICMYSSYLFGAVIKGGLTLHPAIRWVAFFSDYQEAPLYPTIVQGERIRLHENGVISIANINNNEVVIRIRKYEAACDG